MAVLTCRVSISWWVRPLIKATKAVLCTPLPVSWRCWLANSALALIAKRMRVKVVPV